MHACVCFVVKLAYEHNRLIYIDMPSTVYISIHKDDNTVSVTKQR